MSSITRRSVLLTPLVALAIQKHSYRFDQRFPATPAIDIDIVNGAITVRASARNDFRVTADIELSAPIPEDLELAKREVRFSPRPDGSTFRVAVETPEHQRQRYNYRHNVEVEIPVGTRLILRGVNGKVQISYDLAPGKDIYVKNINGEIDLELPAPLNADFQIRTLNGRIYSAFDMAALPDASDTTVTEHGMKRILTSNRFAGGRVGSGGVEIRIEGLNGDIRIVQRKV